MSPNSLDPSNKLNAHVSLHNGADKLIHTSFIPFHHYADYSLNKIEYIYKTLQFYD